MEFFPTAWAIIIAFCIIMYVILDGFTLGTGLCLPFIKDRRHRDIMFSAILPTWDGNQTWLVLAGASLYGAFPVAFSIMLPTLYFPLILMVVALLFRGVVFEFRLKATENEAEKWETLFFVASFIVVFIQGMLLGTYVIGFDAKITDLVIPAYHWLSPFSLFTGVALVFGYTLLGSTRLIMKTERELQDCFYRIAIIALITVGVCMAIVSLWMPFLSNIIKEKWFLSDNTRYLAILPLLSTVAFFWCLTALFFKNEKVPFYLATALFLFGYAGFGYSVFPYIVPHQLTILQAAAPEGSLKFMFIGACVMLPVLLFYTGYSYHIFRGKVKDVISY
ncbi:MAG: cytochrome d ubiquinol oxidase subunit II [Gammaproteobacteria bacterium]